MCLGGRLIWAAGCGRRRRPVRSSRREGRSDQCVGCDAHHGLHAPAREVHGPHARACQRLLAGIGPEPDQEFVLVSPPGHTTSPGRPVAGLRSPTPGCVPALERLGPPYRERHGPFAAAPHAGLPPRPRAERCSAGVAPGSPEEHRERADAGPVGTQGRDGGGAPRHQRRPPRPPRPPGPPQLSKGRGAVSIAAPPRGATGHSPPAPAYGDQAVASPNTCIRPPLVLAGNVTLANCFPAANEIGAVANTYVSTSSVPPE